MSWLHLNQATVLIAHDVQRARQRLERAISKAWLMPEGGIPQPATDPNIAYPGNAATRPTHRRQSLAQWFCLALGRF